MIVGILWPSASFCSSVSMTSWFPMRKTENVTDCFNTSKWPCSQASLAPLTFSEYLTNLLMSFLAINACTIRCQMRPLIYHRAKILLNFLIITYGIAMIWKILIFYLNILYCCKMEPDEDTEWLNISICSYFQALSLGRISCFLLKLHN